MANELSYKITTDAQQATAGITKFGSAVKKELKATRDEFDDTRSAGTKVSDALRKLADDAVTELARSEAAAAALRAELGDVADKLDVDKAVTDLRKLGLTFDDIETDAKQLADAIRHVDDSNIGDIDDTARRAGAGLDDMNASGDQSRSVLANMAGNTAQDLGEVGGVVGTLGVGLGQMAEYATEGNIKMGQLAKVAGPMLGLAVAGLAVQHVMGEIAESKAFHKENVEGFTEAIENGEDAAAGLRDRLREAGEIKFDQGGPFGGVVDATGLLDSMSIGVEQFSTVVTGSKDDLDAYTDSLYRTNGINLETQATVKLLTQYWNDNAKAQKQAAADATTFALSQGDVNNKVREYLQQKDPLAQFPDVWARIADAMANGTNPAVADLTTVTKGLNITVDDAISKAGDLADELADTAAAKAAAQATRDLALADREAAQAAAGHRYEHDQLTNALSDESSWLSLQQQFDDYQQALADADAAVAAGTVTVEEGERSKQQAIISTKQRVIDYATEVLGLPPSVVTDLVAQIDQGKAAQVEAWLAELAKTRTVYFKPVPTGPNSSAFMAGTRNAPGGFANTAEGGPELMTTPGFRFVPQGSAVYTAQETRNIMNALAAGTQPGAQVIDQRTFNVTIVTRATSGRETAAALDNWYRVNGGR